MEKMDANIQELDSGETTTHVLDEPAPADGKPSRAEAALALHAGRACCPGKGCAGRAAALGARRLGAGAEAQRPGRSPRGTGADASSGARPDPVRAHAGVPVRLLPRRRVSHGGRPRGRAPDGIARPALRRRAPLELRHLRGAGPEARLQPQRLRRDAAGAVRVGRQAARREPRGRRPGARLRRCEPALGRDGGGARVPRGDGALRGDAEHRRLVRAPRRRGDPRSARRRAVRQADEALPVERRRACGRRTACERSRSCVAPSTASSGSSAIRRSSPRSRTYCRARSRSTSRTSCGA